MRHPRVDASISPWMAFRASGSEIPCSWPGASTVGCRIIHDEPGQAECNHAIVSQLPDPAIRIPRPTRPLHPVTDADIGEGDAQPDDAIVSTARRWRFPIAFGDQELHSLEPPLPLGIVAMAHTDEAVTAGRIGGAGPVDRARGSAPASLRQDRVLERKLPQNADHSATGLCQPNGSRRSWVRQCPSSDTSPHVMGTRWLSRREPGHHPR